MPYTVAIICLCLLLFSTFSLASDVDFRTLPPCAKGPACFPYHSSKIGCTSLTRHCFCNALAPINCAASNCTNNDWYALEDWYSTQCPGQPPLVSMDPGVPLSARRCIRDYIVPNQCKASITRNCFCKIGNITETISDCIEKGSNTTQDQADELASKFYRSTCVYKEDASGEERPETQAQEEVVPSPEPADDSNSTLSRTLAIVGGIASFITVIGLAWCIIKGCCCGRKARKQMIEKQFGKPPPYTP